MVSSFPTHTKQLKASWLAEPANLNPMAMQQPAMILIFAWLDETKKNESVFIFTKRAA